MRRLLSGTETAAAVFLLLIALLTGGNVLLRGLTGITVPDWFDGTKLLQAIALCWGMALSTWHGTHICVDIVWEHLGAPGRRVVDLVATAVTVAFLAPMAWMVWAKVLTTGTQVTMDLRLPLTHFTSVAAVGLCVAVLLGLARLVVLWRKHGP
jgi:TRAP-type C4-dicarboxylate transport system permease small subunit